MSVWFTESKIKTPIDIGGIIQVQIKVDGQKNTLQGYKIKRSLQYHELPYANIRNILSIITLISKTIPEGITHTGLYDDYIASLPYLEDRATNDLAKNLLELKLMKYLGVSLPTESCSPALQKVYEIIDRIKITKLISEPKMLTLLAEM